MPEPGLVKVAVKFFEDAIEVTEVEAALLKRQGLTREDTPEDKPAASAPAGSPNSPASKEPAK